MSRIAFLRGGGVTLAGMALSDALPAPAAGTPKITYVSDPTPSDSLCVMVGSGWVAAAPQLELNLLPDGEPVLPGSPDAPASYGGYAL